MGGGGGTGRGDLPSNGNDFDVELGLSGSRRESSRGGGAPGGFGGTNPFGKPARGLLGGEGASGVFSFLTALNFGALRGRGAIGSLVERGCRSSMLSFLSIRRTAKNPWRANLIKMKIL